MREKCVLGEAVVTSPGKRVEKYVNGSKATTAFDTWLPAAFLSMFCHTIGPPFVSKTLNCTSIQFSTKLLSALSPVAPWFLTSSARARWQLLKSYLSRKRKAEKSVCSVLARAHAYIHATVDVAAQQKRIVWNVISLSPPSHVALLPDARVCVREEMRQKSRPLFEEPFRHK